MPWWPSTASAPTEPVPADRRVTTDASGPRPAGTPVGWAAHRDQVALGLTVVVLATWNVGRSRFVPNHFGIPASLAMAAAFGGLGWLGGLGWAELGLARGRIVRGLAYGGAAVAVVAVVMVLVGALPATRNALDDARVHVPLVTMLFEVLVAIPFGTVVLEELAFRGTLLGLLRRRLSVPWAVGVMSVLFGLWHVKGVLHDGSGGIAVGAVVGTVLATTVAGVGFGWLRVRSDSLVAPVLAHIATNSVTFVVAWAFWR